VCKIWISEFLQISYPQPLCKVFLINICTLVYICDEIIKIFSLVSSPETSSSTNTSGSIIIFAQDFGTWTLWHSRNQLSNKARPWYWSFLSNLSSCPVLFPFFPKFAPIKNDNNFSSNCPNALVHWLEQRCSIRKKKHKFYVSTSFSFEWKSINKSAFRGSPHFHKKKIIWINWYPSTHSFNVYYKLARY
jgi:hypothetical protein